MCHYFKLKYLFLKNCYGYHLTVGLSCSSLLSVYLFRFQVYLLFVFATMIMLNKDYHKLPVEGGQLC